MFYAPLSTTDIQTASLAAQLEMQLSALPKQTEMDETISLIGNVAEELGGEVLFDLRAGKSINSDMHWVALQFYVDGNPSIVHVLIGEFDDRIWIGQEEDLPERYSRFARTFADLYGNAEKLNLLSGAIVGSIH